MCEKFLSECDFNKCIHTYCMSHACHCIPVMCELVRGKNMCIVFGLWCWH
jgi:hypothetical protein